MEQWFWDFIGCVWRGMAGNTSEEIKLGKSELSLAGGFKYHL